MAKIREDQRKALEALGYKVNKSGMTVQNAKGETLGGFNENNQVFSGNSKVRDILKSKPPAAAPAAPARRAAPAAPKPKAPPARPANLSAPRQRPARPISRTPQRQSQTQEMPVPGRAIFNAVRNAITGRGETDAAKISASGNPNLGRTPAPRRAAPAVAPNRAAVAPRRRPRSR